MPYSNTMITTGNHAEAPPNTSSGSCRVQLVLCSTNEGKASYRFTKIKSFQIISTPNNSTDFALHFANKIRYSVVGLV